MSEPTDTTTTKTKTAAPADKPDEALSGKSKAVRFFRQQILPLVVIVVTLCSVRSSVADWNDVPTGSMKPSIMEGDRIYVNKLAYGLKVPFTTWHLARWDVPRRGEVVVFFCPTDGTRMVKRVAAVPGDTLQLIDNRLFINGKPAEYGKLDADYVDQIPAGERPRHEFMAESVAGLLGTHPVMTTPHNYANIRRSFGPVTVPAGSYFMMGDNRDNSADSRYWGFVPQDNIVGRTSRVVLSLDPEHTLSPRWDRFFRALP
jgi:signal peptidase I